jgi:hypothetical protein
LVVDVISNPQLGDYAHHDERVRWTQPQLDRIDSVA